MPKLPDQNSQYRLIARAAELLLKCAGFLDDSNAAASRDHRYCDTFYAIDTDVIRIYLQPEGARAFNIFSDDVHTSTEKYLAFLVGDFLFQSSELLIPGYDNHKCRFLLIPPHDEELLRMLSAIHRDLASVPAEVDDKVFEDLSSLFETYGTKQETEWFDELRQRVPDLVELFNPYRGPKAALTRYALLPESTFASIDTYIENQFAFPLLDPVHNSRDRQLADDLIKRWFARLKKHKVHKPEYAMRRDAEVLATLEYVNNNLHGSQKQVVLVTASRSIFEAANDYVLDQGATFSEKYLRHPHAFLAHHKFFSSSIPEINSTHTTRVKSFKLIEWLNLIFPTELHPSDQPFAVVRRTYLRKVRDQKQHGRLTILNAFVSRYYRGATDIELLVEKWNTVVASLAEARYADGLDKAEERGAKALAQALNALRTSGEWSVDRLRRMLLKESIGSISELYSTTVWLGLWAETARQQSKGVPALRFDSDSQEIKKYCEAVIQLQLASATTKLTNDKLQELKELNLKVVDFDPSLYHSHVVHALGFAIKGHWYATLTLANTAIAICDHMDPAERGVCQGREAAYLGCIAARRSARNRSGIDEARKYLDEAVKRDKNALSEDIRFVSERLALETRSYYFETFCEHKDLNIDLVENTMKSLLSVLDAASAEKNDWVKHWILRQTLTNYFTLLLLTRDVALPDRATLTKDVSNHAHLFQTVLLDGENYGYSSDSDPMSELICDISTAIWDSDAEKRQKAKTKAKKRMDNWKDNFMPYDRGRLEFLRGSI